MLCKLKKNHVIFEDLRQGEAFLQGGVVYMRTMPVGQGSDVFNAVNLSSGVMVCCADELEVKRINMECKEV